jgi:hypothetical protein
LRRRRKRCGPREPQTEEPKSDELWAGVVKLGHDEVTIVDVGGRWHRVPTTSEVDYERGYTVEGTDSEGVRRVLDRKPLRYIEEADLDEEVIAGFRREPSGDVSFDDFGGFTGGRTTGT